MYIATFNSRFFVFIFYSAVQFDSTIRFNSTIQLDSMIQLIESNRGERGAAAALQVLGGAWYSAALRNRWIRLSCRIELNRRIELKSDRETTP